MSSIIEAQPTSPEHSVNPTPVAPPAPITSLVCASCHQAITGQYVRPLDDIYHANCFRCLDCNAIVTAKFFSFTLPEGKQVPLCEVDYFRRLDLLCANCGQALRGSYIVAAEKKYHTDHFTCSCCTTVFGPQDSYYEHHDAKGNNVYCHYHYSTRCAQKCASCQTAILRQFVEVNRSSRDEAYHLPCHLIQKFWNVKIGLPLASQQGDAWIEEEGRFTPLTLKEHQNRMDELVHRIWTVLSAFEESSAACISDLLKSVSNILYLEAIRSAERFIFHVEVLFAALDELDFRFEALGVSKRISHVRESRVLCRKTVDLFTQLSHAQKDVSRQGITQELLTLITGIAHYLKILLRIALLGALRLRRDYGDGQAIDTFLEQLRRLVEENGDPMASRRNMAGVDSEGANTPNTVEVDVFYNGKRLKHARSREGVTFGFKSLDPESTGLSPYAQEFYDVQNGTKLSAEFVPPSDLCVKCNTTIENTCVRLGAYARWHPYCLACDVCGKQAGAPPPPKPDSKQSTKSMTDLDKDEDSNDETDASKKETIGRLQDRLTEERVAEEFGYHLDENGSFLSTTSTLVDGPPKIYCGEHCGEGSQTGFQYVSRLEQYSYLLNVALLRLYSILKRRGAILPPTGPLRRNPSSPRESLDLTRLRTISLDKKDTAIKMPKRLTIVESPIGKVAQTNHLIGETNKQPQKQKKPVTPPSPGKDGRTSVPPSPSKGGAQRSQTPPVSALGGPSAAKTEERPTPRPHLTRMNSQVAVIEEQSNQIEFPVRSSSPITEEPEEDKESLRLADIQSLVEAEHVKGRRSSLLSSNSAMDSPFLSDLDPLDTVIVKHAALWLLNHSELKDKFDADDILEGIEVRKGGMWNRLFRGEKEKKVKKKGVYGIPLELLTDRDGVDTILGVSRTDVRIPTFLDDIIAAMRQMDVSVEGIFRKNGNIRKMKQTIEDLERDGQHVDFTLEPPIQLAALLKKFFIDLPDPLLTHRLHTLFVATQTVSDEEERRRLLHLALVLLPKHHRSTMEVFFAFLKWVALFSSIDSAGSKMDIPNLSTVIAPSVLSSKSQDPLRDHSFAVIAVVTQILEEQDAFNRVPPECLQILSDKKDFVKCANESSKELLKKCRQHFRGKRNADGTKSPVLSPTSLQFSPGTLHTQKSEGSLDARGRAQAERKGLRDSKSLERKEPRERSNTLRKSKPNLAHAPFSLPNVLGQSISSTKATGESILASLGALSPSIRNSDTPPPLVSQHVPSTMESANASHSTVGN